MGQNVTCTIGSFILHHADLISIYMRKTDWIFVSIISVFLSQQNIARALNNYCTTSSLKIKKWWLSRISPVLGLKPHMFRINIWIICAYCKTFLYIPFNFQFLGFLYLQDIRNSCGFLQIWLKSDYDLNSPLIDCPVC